MSRFRQVVHSIGSSYVLLATNALFSLASVPLALVYLTKEEFGLWALIMQLSGYLALVEIGLSSSVARQLFDFKDNRNGGEYGGIIKTGFFIFCAQGLLLFILSVVSAPWLSWAMKIPSEMESQFLTIFRWQCGITAIGFTSKMFMNLLIAHNRYDIINYASALGVGVSLAVLWFLLHWHYKLLSLPLAYGLSWLLYASYIIFYCLKAKLFPAKDAWGQASWLHFRNLFMLGKDVFLMTIGSQFIQASQTIIVTRALGLEASAIWAICTKTYSLVCQLAWRINDFSFPALTEMVIRRERERFFHRFNDIVMVTASFSALIGVVFAISNNAFVAVWTSGKVSWPMGNNILLGCWLVITSILRCLTNQGLMIKQIGFYRYIYFIEGLIYFGLANLVAPWGGFPAIIGTSILCSLCFSMAYGMRRTVNYFQMRTSEITGKWLWPMCRMSFMLIPLAALLWYLTAGLSFKWQFIANISIPGLAGLFLLLRYGLSESLQREAIHRAPKKFRASLYFLFPLPVRVANNPIAGKHE